MHPDPNPKPDVQVSKHPAFQMILFSLFPRVLELVTSETERLDVIQAVRQFEVRKAVYRYDVVRLRGLGSDHDRAATAVKAVSNQRLPFEVSTTWSALVVDEGRLPLIVFQVTSAVARLIRFR